MAVSEARFTSHPSVCLFSLQSAKPEAHVPEHTPLVHDAVTWFVEHATPHPPQFDTSFMTFLHVAVVPLPHCVYPLSQTHDDPD